MSEDVYRILQRALNNHPVGFAATESGAEIDVLKHIFTPDQAEIVSRLDWHFQNIEKIYEKVSDLVTSKEELSQKLHDIVAQGGLSYRHHDFESWAMAPFIVGMYEYQVGRLSPEFLGHLDDYWRSPKIDEPKTERPGQMRVIPIKESVMPDHRIGRFEDIAEMVDAAADSIALLECICRKNRSMQGHTCERTSRAESCISFRDFAEQSIAQGTGRRISRHEAYEVLKKSQEEGLVLMPSNSKNVEFVCSCCPDCCGMMTGIKLSRSPAKAALSNYQAVVEEVMCTGCGSCAEICPVRAVKVRNDRAVVNLNRCIGCGVCVVRCQSDAISLKRKPETVIPPDTLDDLYEHYESLRS